MQNYVKVPQKDIDAIEEARKELIKMYGDSSLKLARITEITQPMWHIAHRKYKKIYG